MTRAIALTLSCAALALTAAACGESGAGGGDADPASLVPPGAPLYLEATLRPAGELRDDTLAAAGKLLRTDDPAGRLRQLVDDALAQEGDGLTWEKDFAPWVGEQAGVWGDDLTARRPSLAAIVAVRDVDAAGAALQRFKRINGSTFSDRTYRGVSYAVEEDGNAAGLVGDFVVLAPERAFKQTVDASEDDKSLANSQRYEGATDELDDASIAHYYVDSRSILDAARAQQPDAAARIGQVDDALGLGRLGPVAGALTADGDGIALDTVLTGVPNGPLRQLASIWAGGEAALLGELPAEAWAAVATPRLGERAKSLFDSAAGALGGAAIAAQVRQATGLDLETDVFSWIGDVALFVRGASENAVDGAIVIESTDDAKAGDAFGKLIGLVGRQSGNRPRPARLDGAEQAFEVDADTPKPLVFARAENRVVVAFGEAAARAALRPDAKLGDSDLYDDATGVLGDDVTPSFLLSMPAVLRLAEAVGETGPDFAQARPYLETIGAIATGGKADGDRVDERIAVTLK